MTRFAILLCGHWIVDPHDQTKIGEPCPCPQEHTPQVVIARPVDPDATFMPGPETPAAR